MVEVLFHDQRGRQRVPHLSDYFGFSMAALGDKACSSLRLSTNPQPLPSAVWKYINSAANTHTLHGRATCVLQLQHTNDSLTTGPSSAEAYWILLEGTKLNLHTIVCLYGPPAASAVFKQG